jgi:hypothetical protein
MITVKILMYDDVSGKQIVSNVPIDLVDDIEELPLHEFKEMNIFTEHEVMYMPQPEYSEPVLFN